MSWLNRAPASSAALAIGLASFSTLAGCSTLPESFTPSGPQSSSAQSLFNFVMLLSGLILLLVVVVLVYSMIRFRERSGAPEPRQITGNRRIEIAWTAGAALLLAIIFVTSLGTMRVLNETQPNALHVQVIGHQWWWEYRYPDLGITTANELHIPAGAPLRIDVTSADVLHSFWVPQFGRMYDAIPGRTNSLNVQVDQVGYIEGTCTQYCGNEHAWMRIRVYVDSRADFDAWAKQQAGPAAAGANPASQAVFARNTCVSCHAVRGTTAAAQVGPDLTHVGDRTTLGTGIVPNNPEQLRRWIGNVNDIKPGVLMPRFDLPAEDIQTLTDYLVSLK